jgi:hypothetical protein
MKLKERYDEIMKNEENRLVYDLIKRYTKKSRDIVEFGTWEGSNTVAILSGMWKYSKLVTYDKVSTEAMIDVKRMAREARRYMFYTWWDSVAMEIDTYDMMVLDTIHNANYLWAELYDNSKKIKKYIIVCGYGKYGEVGEWDEHLGLRHAIDKFLVDNDSWEIDKVIDEWYGVIVLKRKRFTFWWD